MSTPMIPSARAREQRERSRDVCDDVTNAVRAMIESMATVMRRSSAGFDVRLNDLIFGGTILILISKHSFATTTTRTTTDAMRDDDA